MLRKTTVSKLTKKAHPLDSLVEKLPYWPDLRAMIDNGLAPQEAVELILTEDEQIKYGATVPRTVKRFLQKYLRANKKSYTVKHVKRDKTLYFQVANLVPIVTKRKQRA